MIEAVERLRTDRSEMEGSRRELDAARENFEEDPEGLKTALASWRTRRQEREATLQLRRDELRELLTLDQEATLVSLGILD
jgi:hypothetical protein